jgi:galactose mutarotase-like enzyme
MKTYYLKNNSGSLRGAVLPDYGGMMSELYFHDIPIFYFDPAKIGVTSMLAGGNPILFPFPSRTKDDSYEWNGKQYSMPFHGFVKGAQFGLKEQSENSVTLFTLPSEINKRDNYPFDFRLEVTYVFQEQKVDFIAAVFNNSEEALPHYFGWHPWFKVSDRSKMKIHTKMRQHMDYANGSVHDETEPPDLMKKTDYVFDGRYGSETIVESAESIEYGEAVKGIEPMESCDTTEEGESAKEGDGYRIAIETDEAFDVLVVNTEFDHSFPVEPWLGLPNSINTGKYLKFVPPGEHRDYRMSLRFE